jgi:hypothetical protein
MSPWIHRFVKSAQTLWGKEKDCHTSRRESLRHATQVQPVQQTWAPNCFWRVVGGEGSDKARVIALVMEAGIFFFSILLGEWTRVVFFLVWFQIPPKWEKKFNLKGNIRSQYSRFCWKQITKFREEKKNWNFLVTFGLCFWFSSSFIN